MFVLPSAKSFNFSSVGSLANGLNKIGSEKISLYTGNTPRLTIDSLGNVGIGTLNPQAKLDVQGDLSITGEFTVNDLIVNNNLFVRGSTTTIDSTTLTVDDSMIRLADNNPSDSLDIGFYGMYVDTGVTKYRGIIHDASGNGWKIFDNQINEPGVTAQATIIDPLVTITDTGNLIVQNGTLQTNDGVVRINHNNTIPVLITQGTSSTFNAIRLQNPESLNNGLDLTIVSDGLGARLNQRENSYLDFYTNNALAMRLDSSGNLGIGTNNPGSLLDVEGGDVTLGVTMFHTDFATGLVGIGTVEPTQQLDIINNQDALTVLKVENQDSGTGTGAGIQIQSLGSGLNIRSFGSNYSTANSSIADGSLISSSAGSTGGLGLEAKSGSGSIYFYTGGTTERMRIDNNGLVGINTDNPTVSLGISGSIRITSDNGVPATNTISNFQLNNSDITTEFIQAPWINTRGIENWDEKGSSGTAMIFGNGPYDNTADNISLITNGITRFFIGSTGNIGIGTNAPNGKLDVYSTGDSNIFLTSATTSNAVIYMGDTDAYNGRIVYYNSSQDAMAFHTNNFEQMRIDSSGNVGIGTVNPSQLLHLYSNTNCGLQLDCDADNDGTNIAFIDFYGGGTLQGNIAMNETNSNNLQFNAATSNNIEMVTGGGNVGIGTDNPSFALDVADDINCIEGVINTPSGGIGIFQNILGSSENFGGAFWTIISSRVSVSTDVASAPHGYSSTSDQITCLIDGLGLRQFITLTNSGTYTFSMWGKLTSGSGGTFIVDLGDGSGRFITFSSEWSRQSVTLVAGTNDWIDFTFTTGATNGDVYQFWGAQLVEGSDPLVYISTAGIQDDTTIFQGLYSRNELFVGQHAGTPNLYVNSSGNVGIGTDNPSTKLEVVGTISIDGVRDTSIATNNITSFTNFDKAIHFGNADGYRSYYIGNLGDAATNSNVLAFGGDGGGGNDPNMAMTIDHDGNVNIAGNVGIGTDNPSFTLEVHGSGKFTSTTTNTLFVNSDGTTAGDYAYLRAITSGSSGGDPAINFTIVGAVDWTMGVDNSDSDKLKFGTAFTVGTSTHLTIDTSGNVGIGSASPTVKLDVNGTVAKTGGSFRIPHPNPIKQEQGYMLQHCFVESPTAGDNIYRFECEATQDGEVVEVTLPDYYRYLNHNTDIWINGVEHFGKAYGKISEDETKLLITCEKVGKYRILCIGTRKDDIATGHFVNGVEYINE